jgi:hypothetical protein
MTALSADRNTPRLEKGIKLLDVAASQLIYAGAIVMRNASGYAVKGATALGLQGVGRAEERADNSDGSAGDLAIKIRSGVFRFANSSSSDEITDADIGRVCYAVDDQTVAKTAGSGTRSPAGIVVDVDDNGVHVLFDEEVLGAYLAGRKYLVQIRVATLVGSNSYYGLAPFAGRVTKIWSITEGVLTTGDATLTAKINGTAITGGVLTITQSGSAAGDVDSATPTAANVVAEGDKLSATVGGTNATATPANVFFVIERD